MVASLNSLSQCSRPDLFLYNSKCDLRNASFVEPKTETVVNNRRLYARVRI